MWLGLHLAGPCTYNDKCRNIDIVEICYRSSFNPVMFIRIKLCILADRRKSVSHLWTLNFLFSATCCSINIREFVTEWLYGSKILKYGICFGAGICLSGVD